MCRVYGPPVLWSMGHHLSKRQTGFYMCFRRWCKMMKRWTNMIIHITHHGAKDKNATKTIRADAWCYVLHQHHWKMSCLCCTGWRYHLSRTGRKSRSWGSNMNFKWARFSEATVFMSLHIWHPKAMHLSSNTGFALTFELAPSWSTNKLQVHPLSRSHP